MVKRQYQRASPSSTSAQIRKPAVTTRSRRNQNAELEQQKRFAFDIKRKRKSGIEADTPDEIDRQSPQSYSNLNMVDTIKLEDNESISSPSKRTKLSTDDNIQANAEFRGIKSENGISDDVCHRQNGIEIKYDIDNIDEIARNIAKSDSKDNKQDDCKINEDNICNNIDKIIDNFKDVLEIKGTQMVIGNFVVEYSDYQKFLNLLNKLMDILEMYDSDKILQNAKRIGCKRNTGQVLNPNLFRTKISKHAYKCLNEFQDDFICTCNDTIDANPEKYDAGMNFLEFGARLFEQAYRELPSGIRQLCDQNDSTKGTFIKKQQKYALIQPALDGYVFSSGTIKQPPENHSFQLVGDLQKMVVVSSQSTDEKEIPTLGSILPKIKNCEFELQECRVPGVKFHNYKAYASFAPIYDSSAAMLSYEDTILARTYKKRHHVSTNINDPDDSNLSEEEELSDEDMMDTDPASTSQIKSSEITSSSKKNNSGEESSQLENLKITSSDKQDRSDEEVSKIKGHETNSPNIQNNSYEEISQMKNLESTSSNGPNNIDEISQMEGQMESLEITSSNKQNGSCEEVKNNLNEEINTSSNKQINSDEVNQNKGLEITSSNEQNNLGEVSQVEGLEVSSFNKQNSLNEVNRMEGFEITSNKQNGSGEEINQTKNNPNEEIITSSNDQNNSSEINQMKDLETPSSNKHSSSCEEYEKINQAKNNSNEEIIILSNKQDDSDGVSQIVDIEPNEQNNSGEVNQMEEMEGLEITSLDKQSREEINKAENFEISSSKENDLRGDTFIENKNMENEKLFEDIDVELLYKSIKSKEKDIDKILDENVEIFKKVQIMQEKRLTNSNPNIISTNERELAIKLRSKLADIISEVSPLDIVSLESIEYAMDNLPVKEKFFRGTLPPDKSFACPTNEVSRDAFVSFSGVKRSEDIKQVEYARKDMTTQTKSEAALPQVPLARPSPLTPRSVLRASTYSISPQPMYRSTPYPLSSASMTYPPISRTPMRLSYSTSQGMPANYQMAYPRPSSHVPPYYHPSQRYHHPYGYSQYPQNGGHSTSHSTWQQRPNYH